MSQYYIAISDFTGRIKEMLETQLGVPADKQELKGLIKRKVDDSVRLAVVNVMFREISFGFD